MTTTEKEITCSNCADKYLPGLNCIHAALSSAPFEKWELIACGISSSPPSTPINWDDYNESDNCTWLDEGIEGPTDLNGCISI